MFNYSWDFDPTKMLSGFKHVLFSPKSDPKGEMMIFPKKTWHTLQEIDISPEKGILKMIFLFPRWDMLIPWRVCFEWVGSFTNHPGGGWQIQDSQSSQLAPGSLRRKTG